MLTELKPCPFCGKKEAYLARNCYGQNYVRCPNCGAVVWGSDDESLTEKRAIELWNTRTPIIEEAHTADVVPRAEVAMEIFSEIEKWLPIIDYPIVAELKKKYKKD